jgi:hypothetical protein
MTDKDFDSNKIKFFYDKGVNFRLLVD